MVIENEQFLQMLHIVSITLGVSCDSSLQNGCIPSDSQTPAVWSLLCRRGRGVSQRRRLNHTPTFTHANRLTKVTGN